MNYQTAVCSCLIIQLLILILQIYKIIENREKTKSLHFYNQAFYSKIWSFRLDATDCKTCFRFRLHIHKIYSQFVTFDVYFMVYTVFTS